MLRTAFSLLPEGLKHRHCTGHRISARSIIIGILRVRTFSMIEGDYGASRCSPDITLIWGSDLWSIRITVSGLSASSDYENE
jgi:hypothetical protein